jgi:hypothetical protein
VCAARRLTAGLCAAGSAPGCPHAATGSRTS